MSEMQTWSTDPLPERDRFTGWAEKMRATHLAWELSAPVEEGYAARIRHRGTRLVRMADVRCSAFEGRLDASVETSGTMGIQLQLSGRMMCRYGDQQFTVEPGDLFVWDNHQSGTFASDGPHRQISLLVPTAIVPKSVASMLGSSRPVTAKPGAGVLSIAAGQLRGIAREMEHLNDESVNRTVSGLIDLLDAALAPTRDTTSGQRAALLADIQQYILARLDDPQMSVTSIASAAGVSVRTVHLAFSESGHTVARWVRQQRLERCRRELANPSDSTTVTAVAFRWGFNDASHFSRAFKQEFGIPPTAVMPR